MKQIRRLLIYQTFRKVQMEQISIKSGKFDLFSDFLTFQGSALGAVDVLEQKKRVSIHQAPIIHSTPTSYYCSCK